MHTSAILFVASSYFFAGAIIATFWPDNANRPQVQGPCYCPNNYLQTADYCMHQNWIIGLAVGCSGLVILVLVIALILLLWQKKRMQEGFQKMDKTTINDYNTPRYVEQLHSYSWSQYHCASRFASRKCFRFVYLLIQQLKFVKGR